MPVEIILKGQLGLLKLEAFLWHSIWVMDTFYRIGELFLLTDG